MAETVLLSPPDAQTLIRGDLFVDRASRKGAPTGSRLRARSGRFA